MPTHAEQRILPFSQQQLYDLVAGVERYPEFLPWCLAVRIRKSDGREIVADLMVGFKMVRERFTSRVQLTEPGQRIDVQYIEGPLRSLNNHWRFEPPDEGCLIDFFVDFEFKSRLLQKAFQPLFNEAVRRMVSAFEARAYDLYGPALQGRDAASLAGKR